MQPTFELELRLDRYGQVDTQYYIEEAARLRHEELVSLCRALVRRIKGLVKIERAPALGAVSHG